MVVPLLLPDPDWMARVARRKLSGGLAAGSRDNLSLHKWLLIRNLVLSSAAPAATSEEDLLPAAATTTTPPFEYSSPAEHEVFVWPDVDIFDFPSPDSASLSGEGVGEEAAWLDALLDELDDDDVDDDDVSDFDVVLDVDSEDDSSATRHSVSSPAVAPPKRVTTPPALDLPIPRFPVSVSASVSESASQSYLELSSSSPSSSSVLSECNCTTPPPTPSSSPRTPSLFNDLPFGEYDAVDDESDDESEGPDTPLALSQLQPHPAVSVSVAEPTVVLPESDSYFGFPPITRSPLSSPFPLQEC